MIFLKIALEGNPFQRRGLLKQTWCYWINDFLKYKSWMLISDFRHWLATALSTWRWLTGRRNTDWQILPGDANIFKKNDAGQIDKYLDIKMYFWHIPHDEYLKSFSLTYIHEVTCISTKNLGHVKCLKVICDFIEKGDGQNGIQFRFLQQISYCNSMQN